LEECFWRNFFKGFFLEKCFGEIFWEDFIVRNFLGGFFGRNSLFKLLKWFEYERDWFVCQDFGFCQDFVSMEKEGRKISLEVREQAPSHLKISVFYQWGVWHEWRYCLNLSNLKSNLNVKSKIQTINGILKISQ
jgi:hypothetical protein